MLQYQQFQPHQCVHIKNLQQNAAGIVDKNALKCNNCELNHNLWMCITCGNIGCGRKNWDQTGGNSHGVLHYLQNKHPVSILLGSIGKEATPSIYCYECDDDIIDNNLANHLKSFDIEKDNWQKTELDPIEKSNEMNMKNITFQI